MQEEIDETLLGALQVFMRYGYRKTSLDDIAQHVDLSRQTLYQRYKNKETLFITAVEAEIEKCLSNCRDIVSENTSDIETQLLKVFDAWLGSYIDFLKLSPHAAEIMDVSNELISDCCEKKDAEFVDLLESAFKKHGVPKLKNKKITSRKIAETLEYAGKGAFESCKDREDFIVKMKTILSVVCAL